MSSPEHPENDNPDEPRSEEIRHSHVGALVPAHVARGTFSTGAVVLQGQHEFIVDFLLRMQQPQQVAARVVLPPQVVSQFIQALTDNISKHEDRFGPIPMPEAQQQQQPREQSQRQSAQDLYDQLKLAEEQMSGSYANAVMIGHTATEFSLDFITTFFPKSAVSERVFLAAPNAKRLLDSLKHAMGQFQQRLRQQQEPPTPPVSDPGEYPPGDLPDQDPPLPPPYPDTNED